jgi:putative ABC transport system substrate-binding protein
MRVGRRQFIAGLVGLPMLPLTACSQQPAVPVIGYLSVGSPEMSAPGLGALRQGLKASGYIEGQKPSPSSLDQFGGRGLASISNS